MKLCTFLSLLLGQHFICCAHSAMYDQSIAEGADLFVPCENKGRVTWKKQAHGKTETIFGAQRGQTPVKSIVDPDDRYSLLADLSLVIKEVWVSDEGVYSCNGTSVVNLTVTPLNGGVSGVERMLFVILAALIFFFTTTE